jgi:hypothetical protein
MTYEEKKLIVKKKIEQKNAEFTKEEMAIIINSNELILLFINVFSINGYVWSKQQFELANYFPYENVFNNLDENAKKGFFYNFVVAVLKYSEIPYSSINELLNFINVYINDDKFNNEITELINNKFRDNNYVPSLLNWNETDIIWALDNKRYDLISKVKNISALSDETLLRLINEYPRNEYNFPDIPNNNDFLALKDHLDSLSIKFYLDFYQRNGVSGLDFYSGLLKLIEKYPNEIANVDDINFNLLINSINNNLLPEDKKNFSVFLFKNYFYDNYEDILKNNWLSTSEIINVFVKGMEKNPDPLNILIQKKLIDSKISNDEKFIKALFSSGNFKALLMLYGDKYVPLIIDEINNKSSNYDKTISEISHLELQYPELIDALIKSNKLEKIIYNENDQEQIIKIINNLNNINIENPDDNIISEEVLLALLKSQNYDTFMQLINKNTTFSDNLNAKIAEAIDSNEYFANLVLVNEYKINYLNFLDDYLNKGDIYFDTIFKLLINEDEDNKSYFSHDMFLKFKNYIIDKYKINEYNLLKLEERGNPNIIKYLENGNIIKILRLPKESFDKLINLFPKMEFKISDVEAIYDSVMQEQFSFIKKDIIQMFPNIIHSLNDKNDLYKDYYAQMLPYLDDKLIEILISKYDFLKNRNINFNDLLNEISEKIKNNSIDINMYEDVLHDIVDYYIKMNRENYRKTYNIHDDVQIPFEYDEKNLDNAIILYLLSNSNVYFYKNEDKRSFIVDLIDLLEKNGMNSDLANDCVAYLGHLDFPIYNSVDTIKMNIGEVLKNAKLLLLDYKKMDNWNRFINNFKLENDKNLKKDYITKDKNDESDIYKIISLLNVDSLTENILSNEELYNSLLEIINKKKIICLPSYITDLFFEKTGLQYSENSIAAFISYYNEIYNIILKENSNVHKSLKISDILKYGEVYFSVSYVYSMILGQEDFVLIRGNPGPNNAHQKTIGTERLDEAVQLTVQNYNRKDVTIPTFNEIISGNGKDMRVVVGNFTNPCNLTHGERTGSCMRIGGVGESLFYFCLKDPNGFQIRFEDPDTGQYISRVSGFRNGNTVFLNELRNSLNSEKYSDEDLVEICKNVSKKIIDCSKNSSFPIDNVVIHNEYAVSDLSNQIDLNVGNVKRGLSAFYSDVNSVCVLLASSSKNGKFVPVNFDKSHIPKYLPARDLSKFVENKIDFLSFATRIHSIGILKKGISCDYIKPLDLSDGFIIGICNNDWYVYLDEKHMIHEEIITTDERAIKEMESAKLRLININEDMKKEDSNRGI